MDLTNAGAVPALENALAFAWRRHVVLLNNIANASTPGFHGSDLPVGEFQKALAAATRGQRPAPIVLGGAPVTLDNLRPAVFNNNAFAPVFNGGETSADGNDVVPEIEAAKLAKNAASFTALTQLLARNFDLIEKAIKERN